MFNHRLAMAGLLLATVVAVHAEDAVQAPPPRLPTLLDGPFPTWQVIEGAPEYHPQELRFRTRPKATGPRVELFNGKDLAEFTPWLAYSNGTMFPSDDNDRPLGETGMGDQFEVLEQDGKPAIYIFCYRERRTGVPRHRRGAQVLVSARRACELASLWW